MILAGVMLSSAVAFGAAGNAKPTISINGISDTLSISAGQPVKIAIGLSSGEHDGKEADWWLLRNSSGKWYYYNPDGTWTDIGAAPSPDALQPTYQGRLFSKASVDIFHLPKLSAGNHVYYFGIDLKKNGILDTDSLYYSSASVSVIETWYKDTDGDGYSDGVSVLSATRPYSNYYKESELIAVSGDTDDNNPKVFPAGATSEITRIQTNIQKSGSGWVAEINPISALSKDERKKRLGALLPSSIPKSAKKNYTTRDELPPFLDWRNNNGNFVTPVKDQGNCGSCWAFSTIAALESQLMISTGQSPDLSEQIVMSCSGAGSCEGGSLTAASDFFKNVGVASESCYPYTETDGNYADACSSWRSSAYKIDNWTYVYNTINNLKSAIYDNGPVATTMAVYTDFFYYGSGVYRYTWGKLEGYHGVTIVGWDDAEGCFIVKNTWGPWWGGSGYFRIAYDEVYGYTEFGYLTIAYTAGKSSCIYTLSSAGDSFASYGGTGSVSVTAAGGCAWNAVSNDPGWLTVTSDNGTVSYSVAQYTGTGSRKGTITIAGQIFTVTQYGKSGVSGVVVFPDKKLEAAIRAAINKPSGYILISDLEKLTYLDDDDHKDIQNLEGLQHCTNLTGLYLNNNQISDISALSGLTNLQSLYLSGNQISNINALSGLTKLTNLQLRDNQISDIGALGGLTKLNSLYLDNNNINDISSLKGLTNLVILGLYDNKITDLSPLISNSGIDNGDEVYLYDSYYGGNPLNTTSCNVYIPQLQSRGVRVYHNCP
jgi:C1A family cysteine protease